MAARGVNDNCNWGGDDESDAGEREEGTTKEEGLIKLEGIGVGYNFQLSEDYVMSTDSKGPPTIWSITILDSQTIEARF